MLADLFAFPPTSLGPRPADNHCARGVARVRHFQRHAPFCQSCPSVSLRVPPEYFPPAKKVLHDPT